jgi:hypothetical protein
LYRKQKIECLVKIGVGKVALEIHCFGFEIYGNGFKFNKN